MDDAAAGAPLPVVFTGPQASYLDAALAAVAMERSAHALNWALRGDPAHHAARWAHVTRAAVLAAPDLEAALHAEADVSPESDASAATVRTLTERIAPLVGHAPLGPGIPGEQWVGIAGTAGVPEPERPVLPALGHLALAAANALAPPGAPGRLVIAPLVASVSEPGAWGAGDGPWAGILATRLGVPRLLERELLDLLGLGAQALIDDHEGLHDWIPRPGDPTVRVRIPAGHRGLPLAFCPFVATQRAALDALEDGPLFGEVLERIADAFKDSQDDQRRIPQ